MKNKLCYALIGIILLVGCTGAYLFVKSHLTVNLLDNQGQAVYDLITCWRQGDIIALVRHAERCDRSKNQCLGGEDGIAVPGKKMATKLGKDFQTLCPNGKVHVWQYQQE